MENRSTYASDFDLQALCEKLDVLIAPANYLGSGEKMLSSRSVWAAHELQIRQVLPFYRCALLMPDEDDLDFLLKFYWPQDSEPSYLQNLVDAQIERGIFSLALQQNRPIVTPRDDGSALLLHVLTAGHKILGMFVGEVSNGVKNINEVALKLLSIVMANLAYALDSQQLQSRINRQNRDLELRIVQRTQELQEAKEKAEESSRVKTQFLSVMSHELRTPLSPIIGFARILEKRFKRGNLDEGQIHTSVDQVNIIARSSKHLLELINEILDFSKIESNQMNVERRLFSPLEVLHEVESLTQISAQQKQLKLRFEVQFPYPKVVNNDSHRLKQILLNLISNAIKFSDKGEVLIDSCYYSEGDKLQITVSDQGIGIPQEKFEQIFDPFSQVDDTVSRRYGGTGLGLSISRKLSEAMGGSLRLSSVEGEGTTFTFDIDCFSTQPIDLASTRSELGGDEKTGLPRLLS